MKIKILIVPFMICLIIVLMIWVIYPAFTNPASKDGLLEKMTTSKTEKERLDKMNNKSQNSDSLYSVLSSGSAKKDVIMKYVPEKAKEEEIIDNLNYIATSEGLAVIDLSVSVGKNSPVVPVDPAINKAMAAPQLDASGNPIIIIPKPSASVLTIKYSVIGSYDKIKNVFEKIYKLERFNKANSIEISKPSSKDEKVEVGDSLQVDAEFSFSYLKKISSIQDLENPVFLSSQYDMSIADKIQSEKNVSIPGLPSEASGRGNPFLP
jgi:hypothetical protein